MIYAILFSLGLFLMYIGITGRKEYGRFYDDFYTERKKRMTNLLIPLTYLGPVKYFVGTRKSYSTVIVEDMLMKAGNPMGIKVGYVIAAKFLLATGLGGVLFLYYGLRPLMGITRSIPVYLIFLAMVSAFYLPSAVLSCLVRIRKTKVDGELGLFTEVVFICLKAKLSLRESLEEAAKTTDYLKPYLMICLNEWLNDRLMALNNLKRNVGTSSFQLVVELLIQAAAVGDDNIADYLQENKRMEDELKNLETSARSKIRPLLLTIQLALPFIVILMVLFYPLITQVDQLMNKI